MQGFVPADKVLLFRQKDPKPFLPVRDPKGVPWPSPRIKLAQKLAALRQSSPEKSDLRHWPSRAQGRRLSDKWRHGQNQLKRQSLRRILRKNRKGVIWTETKKIQLHGSIYALLGGSTEKNT